MRPQERRHDSDRSLLPGTDTYYGSGERQAFKKRDEKTGNLSSQEVKTNAAVGITIGHWLDSQHDGYDGQWGASRPNKWNFYPTVSREYMRLSKLPIHHQVVFDLNAEGKSTAQSLDQSWQKPRGCTQVLAGVWGCFSTHGYKGLLFFPRLTLSFLDHTTYHPPFFHRWPSPSFLYSFFTSYNTIIMSAQVCHMASTWGGTDASGRLPPAWIFFLQSFGGTQA